MLKKIHEAAQRVSKMFDMHLRPHRQLTTLVKIRPRGNIVKLKLSLSNNFSYSKDTIFLGSN